MDPEASIINSRRAMEFALKWMYSVDKELEMPYRDNLQSLMNAEEYRQIIGPDLWKRMDFIRRCGNNVAHSGKKLGRDEAMLCLENLFIYLDYIAYCYSDLYVERAFDPNLITEREKKAKENREQAEIDVLNKIGIVFQRDERGVLRALEVLVIGKAVNKSENQRIRRPLAQKPAFSVQTLLSGKFREDFESYSLDQFPLRQPFRSVKSLFHTGVLGQKDNNGIYLTNGTAVKQEYPLNRDSVNHALGRFQRIYDQYLQENRECLTD